MGGNNHIIAAMEQNCRQMEFAVIWKIPLQRLQYGYKNIYSSVPRVITVSVTFQTQRHKDTSQKYIDV